MLLNMVSRGWRIGAALLGLAAWLALAPPAIAANNARTSAQPINSATSNANLTADLFQNESVATFYVSGLTASGATLTVEGSSDGRNDNDALKAWFAINAIPMTCPATPFTTLTVDQGLRIDTSGLTNVRVRVSSTGTGNILVSYNAIPGAASTIGACGSLPVTIAGSGGGSVIAVPYSFTAMAGGQYNQAATAATSLTIPTGALYVRVCAIGGAFNFVDSTNGTPTTGASPTVGTPLLSGYCVLEQGPTVLSAFSLINQVASTGTWTAVYFK